MSLAEARLSASFISNSLHFCHYAEITRRRAGLTSTFDTTDLEIYHCRYTPRPRNRIGFCHRPIDGSPQFFSFCNLRGM
jgi:hypothetical protein